MLINTAEKLFDRSSVVLLETYYKGGTKVYKFLLSINRYDKGVYSPIVVDNLIMTIQRDPRRNHIWYNVSNVSSRRCRSMFATYQECLGEHEFAEYIKMVEHQVKAITAATGLAGHRAHIVRREAWSSDVLAGC